jgi:hypothetical protein
MLGRWDETLRVVDLFEQAPSGVELARTLVRSNRALIRAARGRPDEALDELEVVLADARAADDPQLTWPNLTWYAKLARRFGRAADADAALTRLVDGMRAHESVGDPGIWHAELVLELFEAGRGAQSDEIVQRMTRGVWRDLAEATAEQRFVDAADLLDGTGEQTFQAEVRLRAAKTLIAEGRIAEGLEQAHRARSFWETVAATAYLRETDELVAAAV